MDFDPPSSSLSRDRCKELARSLTSLRHVDPGIDSKLKWLSIGSDSPRRHADFTGSIDVAYALAIQSDGKIVAAWGYDFTMARYLP